MSKNQDSGNKKPFEIPRPVFPKRAVVTGGMPYGNKELHFGHVGGMLVFADTYARFLRDRIDKENVIFVSGLLRLPDRGGLAQKGRGRRFFRHAGGICTAQPRQAEGNACSICDLAQSVRCIRTRQNQGDPREIYAEIFAVALRQRAAESDHDHAVL